MCSRSEARRGCGRLSARAAVNAAGISFGYDGGRVIDGLSLSVAPGELVTISGPNGSGKTTLLNLLSGALAPDSGTVEINGKAVADFSRRELAKAVALMPQYLPYSPWLTVREIVALGRYPHMPAAFSLWERGDDASEGKVAEAMEKAGIAHLADRLSGEISGGELRRTHLARVLAQGASIVLADEPTGDLDLQHVGGMIATLRGLAEGGAAVAAVTHDLNFALALGGRLVLMARGKIAADGIADEMLTQERLASLYGGGFRIEALVSGGRAVLPASSGQGLEAHNG
ncbi:MAG: ABC transporter ATP-binding protein [bacterium]